MRVVAPTGLSREAAEILHPVRDDIVVIGALAVQIALEGHEIPLTPTLDVDAGISTDRVAAVVAHLEGGGLRRSEDKHEQGFTWVRDKLKVQLVRPFHPFPKPPADRLPVNNLIRELSRYRWLVAFEEDPERGLFWAARPAALVGLKEAAFGRTRPSGEKVDRDYSDVVLLLENEHERISEEVSGDGRMRSRVRRAAQRLSEEPAASESAVRELVASGCSETPREAAVTVERATRAILGELQ